MLFKKKKRVIVKLRPILPQNFLIDPIATSVEEALGVAIDEFVPKITRGDRLLHYSWYDKKKDKELQESIAKNKAMPAVTGIKGPND